MPHQCIACERLLPRGSREMLGGCPRCGGNRFQYLPADGSEPSDGTVDVRKRVPERSTEPPGGTGSGELIIATSEPLEGDASPGERGEGTAQADARSSVVDPSELPTVEAPPAEAPPDRESEPADTPEFEELREELADTFGSIRIVERGEYELNLMELYEKEACIIQLEKDGRYVIDVPDMFGD